MDIRSRVSTLKLIFSSWQWIITAIVILLGYFAFNFWINQFHETFLLLLSYRLSIIIPYMALSIVAGVLVALNLTVVIWKLKQVSGSRKEAGSTSFGVIGGLLAGGCPGCFVGLLPTLTGGLAAVVSVITLPLFGFEVNWQIALSSLPFLGFEILIPTVVILLTSLYFIAKPDTCKVDFTPVQKNAQHA